MMLLAVLCIIMAVLSAWGWLYEVKEYRDCKEHIEILSEQHNWGYLKYSLANIAILPKATPLLLDICCTWLLLQFIGSGNSILLTLIALSISNMITASIVWRQYKKRKRIAARSVA